MTTRGPGNRVGGVELSQALVFIGPEKFVLKSFRFLNFSSPAIFMGFFVLGPFFSPCSVWLIYKLCFLPKLTCLLGNYIFFLFRRFGLFFEESICRELMSIYANFIGAVNG